MKNTKQTIKIIILGLLLSGAAALAANWSAPGQTYPSGNAPAPINMSGTAQIKSDAFGLNNGLGVIGTSNGAAWLTGHVLNVSSNANSRLYVSGKIGVGVAPSSSSEALEIAGAGTIKTNSLAHGASPGLREVCVDSTGTLVLCAIPAPGVPVCTGNQTFASTGSFTFKTPWCTTASTVFTIKIWGAGGGGGGAGASVGTLTESSTGGGGGGGGGGGYSTTTMTGLSAFQSYTGTVGGGGAGGPGLGQPCSGSSGVSGGTGGQSSFNGSSVSNGGFGGLGNTGGCPNNGGSGGGGGAGGAQSGSSGSSGSNPVGGSGGGGVSGGGGAGGTDPGCNNLGNGGSNGGAPGAGGGGGGGGRSCSPAGDHSGGSGGNGANGRVEIIWQ